MTADGLVEDTAPGRAVASAATSELSDVTTALLELAHLTVPTTLLATVDDVLVDGWFVVVVLAVVLDEHPAIASAATSAASAATCFLMMDLSSSGQSISRSEHGGPRGSTKTINQNRWLPTQR